VRAGLVIVIVPMLMAVAVLMSVAVIVMVLVLSAHPHLPGSVRKTFSHAGARFTLRAAVV
jgi:hypothetical protein